MMTATMSASAQGNDSELVARSLAGDRHAFGEIVARYQSLVCSLAYSATGSLAQSEDLAQETFLAAWKQLNALREPAKLRSWLCAIARNIINNNFRKQGREPVYQAAQLEDIDEPSAQQKAPVDEAISKEEEALLWRSLESVPPLYRAPLILFYREGQSVERVAAALEISEDNAKQRLSRGRKLLQEQVTAFVEGALTRSVPGKAFTIAVVASLPVSMTISAKAATMAAGAAKGSSSAKAAAATGLLGALLTPFMAVFGTWMGYRLAIEASQSEAERVFVKRSYKTILIFALGTGIPMFLIMVFAQELNAIRKGLFATLLLSVGAIWLVTFGYLSITQWKRRARMLKVLEAEGLPYKARPYREYLCAHRFLGLPLYHIRIGGGMTAQRKTVKAWIAIGDCAIGGLFAFGGVAIAPVSIGGCAIGLLPFGGCAIGGLALGGFALGYFAFGSIGAGWFSFSAAAIAWKAASGGVALAHDYAVGGYAEALQSNNEAAKQFILAQPFFRLGYATLKYLPLLNLVWVVPMFRWWRAVKKAKQS
ncbi:MAG: polymerase sigma factor [Verrucomicrobiales bacterium]|nr:polymerase sigma factor [Verrucomicrobiales bacterium]